MSYHPIPPTAGKKIIKDTPVPAHLDFGLFDDIEIKVNRNTNFEEMVRMFSERDVIYLTDFARLTKYPNKLHSMARERGWDIVRENDRVVGYRRPKPPEIKAKPKKEQKPKEEHKPRTFTKPPVNGEQTLSYMIEVDLINKGEVDVEAYISQGYSRSSIHTIVYRLRENGMLIVSQNRMYKLVG